MDETSTQRKTLFVRNLPYSTTDDQLESIFDELGPIRQCFVVKEKGAQTCRGFGYVKFSLLEDAVKAKEAIKSYQGRKLFLTYADPNLKSKSRKKQKKGTDKDKEDEEAVQEKDGSTTKKEEEEVKEVESYPADKRNRCFRTIIVRGFDPSLTTDHMDSLFVSVKAVEHREYPRKGGNDFALFTFRTVKDANTAIRKLNGKTVKGYKLSAIQQSAEKDKPPVQVDKKARLIVRNLSFQCTESQLRKAFEAFGEVIEVTVPQRPDGKQCGFGFVQFGDVAAAKEAVTQMNTKLIAGRPVAVDWSIPKDVFLAATKKNVKTDFTTVSSPQKGTPSKQSGDVEDSSKSVKTKSKEQKDSIVTAKMEEGSSDKTSSLSDDEDPSEEEELSDDEDEKSDSQADGESEDDEDDLSTSEDEGFDDDDSEEDQEEDLKKLKGKGKPSKPRKTDVEEGRTLFIRNVPFSSTSAELSKVFGEYGDVVYCKLVMDLNLNRPKGTAFVQFKTKTAADSCLKKSENMKDGGISVSGRLLLVIPAISKNEAEELSKKEKTKEKKDTRNLYLAREGLIRPGTQAAIGLSQTDLGKRTKVFTQMREKLKNPNIFVSSTRLSVHNIPTSVDDQQLKKVFIQAMADKSAVLKECRIMRDMNRLNLKGVGKSRGFGFVEFTEHKHALSALQAINNNPSIFQEQQRPIVHFSLENKQALALKERRLQRLKQKQEMVKKASTEIKQGDKKRVSRNPGKSEDSLLSKEQNKIARDLYKGPKGLPKHFGPKVRHKTRVTGQAIDEKAKKKSTHKDMSSLKREIDLPDMSKEPSKKKRKRGKVEVSDNFDKLVNKYKEQFIGAGNKSKWFDT